LFQLNVKGGDEKATYHKAHLLRTARYSDAIGVQSLQERRVVQMSRSYWREQWQQQVCRWHKDLLRHLVYHQHHHQH